MSSFKKLPEFVLFGDSLTEWSFDKETRGFGWALQKKYEGKVQIINQGYAGYTSSSLSREYSDIIERATAPNAAPTLLFTIFLGANDACLLPEGPYVPLDRFETNLRSFTDTILKSNAPGLAKTKIVLITPPPVNIPDPLPEPDLGPAFASSAAGKDPKQSRSYLTYMSKKEFGDQIMKMAASYSDTGRVAGLNFWQDLVDAGLRDEGRLGNANQYDELRLPGCGLDGAKEFGDGYFTDGLHLDKKSYDVLSKGLMELIEREWPELEPGKIRS